MSGVEGAGWNNSMIDDAYAYSTTVMHETGHYLLGFFDEYLDAEKNSWGARKKPYKAYGLMDNQHEDIETALPRPILISIHISRIAMVALVRIVSLRF